MSSQPGAGRPPAEIDFKQFENLCGIWCTQKEIASFLRVHPDTLRDKVQEEYGEDFSTVYKRFFEAGTPSFRRERRILAKKNAAMNIWLGKIHLGERDKDEIKDEVSKQLSEVLPQFFALMNRNPVKEE